jgi:hypothetical protein
MHRIVRKQMKLVQAAAHKDLQHSWRVEESDSDDDEEESMPLLEEVDTFHCFDWNVRIFKRDPSPQNICEAMAIMGAQVASLPETQEECRESMIKRAFEGETLSSGKRTEGANKEEDTGKKKVLPASETGELSTPKPTAQGE